MKLNGIIQLVTVGTTLIEVVSRALSRRRSKQREGDMEYQTRPQTVDAVQFKAVEYDPEADAGRVLFEGGERPEWVDKALAANEDELGSMWPELGWTPHMLGVFTREGATYAEPGDWIIRDARGGLCVRKPAPFAASYDKVEG